MPMIFAVSALVVAVAPVANSAPPPNLGDIEGRCRPSEPGPAIVLTINGLKDRTGSLRAELYPPLDPYFLGDDNQILREGLPFRRAVATPPQSGPVRICLRIPAAGKYSLAVIHNRTGRRKFSILSDGIAFPGNPKLGLSQPRAAQAIIMAGPQITQSSVTMNYHKGLFSFGPL